MAGTLNITRTAKEALQKVSPPVREAAYELLGIILDEGKSAIRRLKGTKIDGNYHVAIPAFEEHTMVLSLNGGHWFLLAIK